MSRSINEIEDVFLSVICLIDRANGLGLDGDTSFPFELHIVKDLLLHFPCGKKACFLYDTIGKRRLAVIDMCNYAKIPDKTLIHKNLYKNLCTDSHLSILSENKAKTKPPGKTEGLKSSYEA